MDVDSSISLPCREFSTFKPNLLFCQGVEGFSGVWGSGVVSGGDFLIFEGVLGWGLVSFCICLFVCLFLGFFRFSFGVGFLLNF